MTETYKTPGMFDRHYTVAIGPYLNGDSTEVGNITTDSDQPNQGPDIATPNGVFLKARITNGGVGFFGFSSGVDSSAFELSAGDLILIQVDNMNKLWFKTDTVGNKFCWLKA